MDRNCICPLMLLLSLSLCLPAQATEKSSDVAAPTDDAIVRIIEKSNVVPGYKISARLDKEEAIVSTYRNLDSKKEGLDNDCKIDAALIAKELLLTNDVGIKRVRVHFHEPTLTGTFREIVITLPEVKAFATGVVTQQEFLDSIAINKLPEQHDRQPTTTPSRKPPPAEPVSESTGKPAIKPERPLFTTRNGIAFEVPDGWKVDVPSAGADVLATLTSSATRQDNILLRAVRGARKPATLAAQMRKQFTYTGVSFERYESTNFGKGACPGALISIVYPHESGTPYYDIHLYFGEPPNVFELYGWSSMTNARTVKQAFGDLMTTMSVPGATGTPRGAQKSRVQKPVKK